MRLLISVQFIFVFIHQTSTQTVSSSYRYHPGLVWGNCTDSEPVSASLLKCAMMCSQSDTCLGINFQEEINSKKPCRRCVSSNTTSVSPAPPTSSSSLYFRFNSESQRSPLANGYIVDVPNGLVEGQAIFFRTKPVNQPVMALLFRTGPRWQGDMGSEIDFLVSIQFLNSSSDIKLDNYDVSTDTWASPEVTIPGNQFLLKGMDTYTVIFVREFTYTLFIDGKLVYEYPRTLRKYLHEIVKIYIVGEFPSVNFMSF